MIRVWISVFALVFVLITGNGFCAEQEQPRDDKTSIFLKEVPGELTSKIDKQLAGLSKKYPLSAKGASAVAGIVKEFRPDPSASSAVREAHSRRQRGRMGMFGPSAIPALARIMLSGDDGLRLDGMDALDCVVNPTKCNVKRDKEIDPILVLILHRCLLDNSPEVRLSAIGSLSAIGEKHLPDIPNGVKTGLEQAEQEDPVLANRQAAHICRVTLRLTEQNPELVPEPICVE